MAKTINRTPSFFDAKQLDEKYANFNTFAGICGNKNYLGIDQTTFEDANNMYVDQDAQLSSRPPIKQVAFVHGVIIKIYKINSLVVYHTLDDDKYYVHFKFEETWYSREVTEKINITWWDKRYVIFTETEIIGFTYDYYNDTITWYNTEAMIYIPITELISGSVKTINDAENVLTTTKIIRYIFRPGVNMVVTDLVDSTVTVDIDGEKYTITFVRDKERVFVSAIGTFVATHMESSEIGNFLAFKSNGDMYYSLDGLLFYPITRPSGIRPFLSDDGMALYGINTPNDSSSGTVYYMSLNITTSSQIPSLIWTNYAFNMANMLSTFNINHWANSFIEQVGNNYVRWMSSMTVNSVKFYYEPLFEDYHLYKGYPTFGNSYEDGLAVFAASFKATVTCVNNKGNGYLTYDKPADMYWYDGSPTARTIYGTLFVIITNGTVTVRLIDYSTSDGNFNNNAAIGKIKITPAFSTNNTPLNIVYFTEPSYGDFETKFVILNGTTPLGYFEEIGDYPFILCKRCLFSGNALIYNEWPDGSVSNEYEFDIRPTFSVETLTYVERVAFNEMFTSPFRTRERIVCNSYKIVLKNDYSQSYYNNTLAYPPLSSIDYPNRIEWQVNAEPYYDDRHTSPYLDRYYSDILATVRTKFKLGDTTCLTNNYFRINKRNIPLLNPSVNNLPMYSSENRLLYYNRSNSKIYDNTAWLEAYVDLIKVGVNNIFVPYVFGTFITNVVGYKNKAYISILIDGRIYLPITNELSFSDEVTNFAVFSQTALGIFSENEVHELQYDNGVYRLSLTKLQLGCKKDSDILLNYDGKTIFLTTLKGLNALNYQDFVQSTEYVYNYLTENIMSMYDTYAKSPIKLYQFKNWVFMYRQNVNYLFLFDLRNSSWWKWTNIANISQILFDGDKLLLVINGDLFEYDFETDEYVDDVGQRIDWMFKSQKLHFSAPNNYKHVKSVSIITPQDVETTLRYKMEFRNYRDLSNLSETDVFERDVDLLSTVIKKVNFVKTNAFQFTVMNDIKNPFPKKFVTPNIAIKYRITERLR